MFDDGTPIFQQLADRIAGDVLSGTYAEGDQVASTNEFAAFYRINPATAGKAVSDSRAAMAARRMGRNIRWVSSCCVSAARAFRA